MFAGKSLSDSSFPFWSNDLGMKQWHDKEYECHRGNPRSPANGDAKLLHNDFFNFPSSTFAWKQTLIEPDFTFSLLRTLLNPNYYYLKVDAIQSMQYGWYHRVTWQ